MLMEALYQREGREEWLETLREMDLLPPSSVKLAGEHEGHEWNFKLGKDKLTVTFYPTAWERLQEQSIWQAVAGEWGVRRIHVMRERSEKLPDHSASEWGELEFGPGMIVTIAPKYFPKRHTFSRFDNKVKAKAIGKTEVIVDEREGDVEGVVLTSQLVLAEEQRVYFKTTKDIKLTAKLECRVKKVAGEDGELVVRGSFPRGAWDGKGTDQAIEFEIRRGVREIKVGGKKLVRGEELKAWSEAILAMKDVFGIETIGYITEESLFDAAKDVASNNLTAGEGE